MSTELDEAVAEAKRQLGQDPAPAYLIATKLPEHLREPFWEQCMDFYLKDQIALAEAALESGWGKPGEIERLRAEVASSRSEGVAEGWRLALEAARNAQCSHIWDEQLTAPCLECRTAAAAPHIEAAVRAKVAGEIREASMT